MGRKRREHHLLRFFLRLLISISAITFGFWLIYRYSADTGGTLQAAPVLVPAKVEEIEYLPKSAGEIVHHSFYSLSFNNRHKQANWVYYRLKSRDDIPAVQRSDNFREDPNVKSGSAKPSDYTKSGYDRGHLCPAADMTQSAKAMSETFYMSNMSPQVPSFNRGIWKNLEEQVRKWGKNQEIDVVTGPVFKDDRGQIGKSRVTVPGYYYKIIYSSSRQLMIGFLLPNTKIKDDFRHYTVTVDSLESVTGIDFFPQLPDSLENRLEAYSNYNEW